MNIAVFASGRGSNFSAIMEAYRKKIFKADISLLVCDNPLAPVLKKAKKEKVPVLLVQRKDFPDKAAFEAKIIDGLKKKKVSLIVLAGFMRILSPLFVRRYKNRILNIHPALLPAFKGAHAIKDAYLYGARITGVTVHFVDAQADNGPIILQEEVKIALGDKLESLERKIHAVEHKLYPQAIKLFAENKLRVRGRKVIISSQEFPQGKPRK